MSDHPTSGITREMLLTEIGGLRRALRAKGDSIPYAGDLLAILLDTEDILASGRYNTPKLRQNAFGIFRLVTDSQELELDSVGQGLMEFHARLWGFVHAVEGEGRGPDH